MGVVRVDLPQRAANIRELRLKNTDFVVVFLWELNEFHIVALGAGLDMTQCRDILT